MVEQRALRRLAAILAADVVGYSRLMEHDEAGTLAALKARRKDVLDPLVTRHHGRIFKTTGDGVLVEFASAVNAVACAVELQEAMDAANRVIPEDRRIVLRVGINLGDVMVEGSDLYGDGFNIAARLESMAEPGGIMVSGTAHDHVGTKVKVGFEELGVQTLKNISQPVRAYRVAGRPIVTVVASKPTSDKPSIAVLPFTNMSGDPEQEYFSDGITEDIITELARFRNLSVIARNSSFTYRGKAVKIATIARELAVEYVLEGSVRRVENRVRITAQLVDATSGNHVWAERYDRELADIFAVQDEITRSVVGTLALTLEDDALERAKRKPPENLQAYEFWLRGKKLLWISGSPNLEARRYFQQAIAIDPNFSWAHAGLSLTYQIQAQDYPSESDFKSMQALAHDHALIALTLDETTYQANVGLAWTYLYRNDYDRAKKHLERALALNPNDADSLANAAYLFAMFGEAEAGIMTGQMAVRLNPRHPDWYLAFLAMALFTAHRYDEALVHRMKAPDIFFDSPFHTAAVLSHLGRVADARFWADKAVRRMETTPRGASLAGRSYVELLLANNPFRRQEDRDHFASGLRNAGVPG